MSGSNIKSIDKIQEIARKNKDKYQQAVDILSPEGNPNIDVERVGKQIPRGDIVSVAQALANGMKNREKNRDDQYRSFKNLAFALNFALADDDAKEEIVNYVSRDKDNNRALNNYKEYFGTDRFDANLDFLSKVIIG